jgi:BASS family bile acid:Na+ symporter
MGQLILQLLQYVVAALVLAMGLRAAPSDATWLWRRPSLLLRSLLAMYVLVPGLAFLMATRLPLSGTVKAALLVLAVSAGAPLLARKARRVNGDAYALSLVATTSLLAIAVVPAWVALMARHFGVSEELPVPAVAMLVGKAFLLPFLAGMAVNALLPTLAERVAPLLYRAAGVILLVMALILLAGQWRLFVALPGATFASLVVFLALALLIGHVLGGPDPEDRSVLGIACATRHVGIAAIVAAAYPGPAVAAVVAGYLGASMLVTIPYMRWRRAAASPSG